MTKREADARCSYAVCECVIEAMHSLHKTLSWKDSKALDEYFPAEAALNRLLLILNNRIAEETAKRRKQ